MTDAQLHDLDQLIGTVLADRYRVDEVLGEGGMGAVFRGRHLGLRRDVAVKVLHPELTQDETVSKRFEREAQSASRLEHPNILEVTDFGSTETGMKFMVMQLVDGEELADELGGALPPERAVALMAQILAGLSHAHERGIVHRDLKPENVLVTTDHEGKELLKIVDFGIAKIVSGEGAADAVTRAGMIFGTPHYMSPEQATGKAIDARTDIYSAGVILYQMLGGMPPFVGADVVDLLKQHIAEPPPPLEDVPEALCAVTYRMLEKDPEDRFASAAEARRALLDALGQPAGEAGAVSPTAETAPSLAVAAPRAVAPRAKAGRRAPLVVAAALGVTVVVLGLHALSGSDDGDAEPPPSVAEPAAPKPQPEPAAAVPAKKPDVGAPSGMSKPPSEASKSDEPKKGKRRRKPFRRLRRAFGG